MKKRVEDADGTVWEYRQTSSVLERRKLTSSVWLPVMALNYVTMTPDELRCVADVIDSKA